MSWHPGLRGTRLPVVRLVATLVLLLAAASAQAVAVAKDPQSSTGTDSLVSARGVAPPAMAALSAYDRAVLADRPVGFWHDARGTDLVGGRHAARVGRPGTARMPNGDTAARFDGSREYLEVADHNRWSPATTGILTIEAWARPSTLRFTSGQADDCYVHWLGKGVSGQQEWTLRMYSDVTPCETPQRPNRTSVYAFNLDGGLGTGAYFQGGLNGVPVMRPGQWVHVAGVINANNKGGNFPNGYIRMYRNGRLINTRDLSSTAAITLGNGSAPVRIGTRDLASFFQGAIGKVALYDYEVPTSRLLTHYNAM